MGNKVLAIHFLYWYWYGPYFYQQVLILVLLMLFSPKIFNTFQQYFFKNSNITDFSACVRIYHFDFSTEK